MAGPKVLGSREDADGPEPAIMDDEALAKAFQNALRTANGFYSGQEFLVANAKSLSGDGTWDYPEVETITAWLKTASHRNLTAAADLIKVRIKAEAEKRPNLRVQSGRGESAGS